MTVTDLATVDLKSLLRVYLDPAEIGQDGYPLAWHKGAHLELIDDAAEAGLIDTEVADGAKEILGSDGDGTPSIKDLVRELADHRCLRCGHPYTKGNPLNSPRAEWSPCDDGCKHAGPIRWRYDEESDWLYYDGASLETAKYAGSNDEVTVYGQWRILTVHHLNGLKHDCRWWNLVSLCQRCHLLVQGKVILDRPYHYEHSEWFKPFAAGFYAWKYLGEELTLEQTTARMRELLALEEKGTVEPLF